jgi:hypothetical protein
MSLQEDEIGYFIEGSNSGSCSLQRERISTKNVDASPFLTPKKQKTSYDRY